MAQPSTNKLDDRMADVGVDVDASATGAPELDVESDAPAEVLPRLAAMSGENKNQGSAASGSSRDAQDPRVPATECTLSRDDLVGDGLKLSDFCFMCKDYGKKEVRVAAHSTTKGGGSGGDLIAVVKMLAKRTSSDGQATLKGRPRPMTLPTTSFLGRSVPEERISHIARANYAVRNSKEHADHWFVVVPGHVRVGKTRVGYETPRIVKERLAGTAGLVEPVYLLVDFSNGCTFHEVHDLGRTDDRLGARLAYAGLSMERQDAFAPGATIRSAAVVNAIVRTALAQEAPDSVVPIIVHMDEYGHFIRRYMIAAKCKLEEAVVVLQDMICVLGRVMCGEGVSPELKGRFFILPVLSGTSLWEVDMRFSRFMIQEVALSPLSFRESRKLAEELLLLEDTSSDKSWTAALLGENDFLVALGDTGGLPGLIEKLIMKEDTTSSVFEERSYSRRLLHVLSGYHAAPVPDWALGAMLDAVLGQLVVTRQTVLAETSEEKFHVADLERLGCVLLVPVDHNKYTMRTPFPLLRNWNEGCNRVDDEIFRLPSRNKPFTWDEFEVLVVWLLQERINVLVRHNIDTCSVPDLVLGCKGCSDLVIRGMRVVSTRVEVSHFVKRRAKRKTPGQHVPPAPVINFSEEVVVKRQSVSADDDKKEVSVSIYESALVCATGNPLVDARLAFTHDGRKQVLWLQMKQSQVGKGTITTQQVERWYKETQHRLSADFAQHTVILAYVTNRRLTDPDRLRDLLTACPRLALVTRDEWLDFCPLFAHRGILAVPAPEDSDEEYDDVVDDDEYEAPPPSSGSAKAKKSQQ